jgi:hypothetical protein
MVHYLTAGASKPAAGRPDRERGLADEARLELAAMHAISVALTSLPDSETRQRVIRWIVDRFRSGMVPREPQRPVTMAERSPSPGAERSPSPGKDGDLDLEGVEQFFDEEGRTTVPARTTGGPEKRLESLIRDFASDFQRFADEWEQT